MTGIREKFTQRRELHRDLQAIRNLDAVPCDSSSLVGGPTLADLRAALESDRVGGEWREVEEEIRRLKITDKAGGVNPGDRRAIYHLVRHFKPRRVLEIGTHIGASTVHIAAALRMARQEDPEGAYALTSVDVMDVNARSTRPWLLYGSTHSPAEMIERLAADELVSFITRPSLAHLCACEEEYDFIFLDGDHSAGTVYREVPAALRVLSPGGLILLHDFFPERRPLWHGGNVIPGPWLAIERLRSEGAQLHVLPLGELPWPTKLGSHVTSLAVLVAG